MDSRFSGNVLSHGSRQLILLALDSELDNIQKAFLRARRMRNMNAGPCALPPEILTLVFEYLQSVWSPWRDAGREDLVFSAGWMCVTHVCSFWRKVRVLQCVTQISVEGLIYGSRSRSAFVHYGQSRQSISSTFRPNTSRIFSFAVAQINWIFGSNGTTRMVASCKMLV